jgi:hypothetical protein
VSECGSRSASSKGGRSIPCPVQLSSKQHRPRLLAVSSSTEKTCSIRMLCPKLNVRDRGKEIEYGRRRSIGFIEPRKGRRQRYLTWKLDASKDWWIG